MDVREAPEHRYAILEAVRTRSLSGGRDRTVAHLTDEIFCLMKKPLRESVPLPESDNDTIIWMMGRAHEEVIAARRQLHMVQSAQLMRDGIVGTVDLLENRVIEIKSTRKSLRAFEQDFLKAADHYIAQGKGYLAQTHGTDSVLLQGDLWVPIAEPLNTLQLDVLFINGSYKPLQPDLRCWEITFSDDELAEHWAEILVRRARQIDLEDRVAAVQLRLQQTVEGTAPYVPLEQLLDLPAHPFGMVVGYDWECSFCAYAESVCRPPHLAAKHDIAASKRIVEAT